jgi:hypothetical protein
MSGEYVNPGKWRHAIAKSDLPPGARLVAHTLALYVPKGQASTFVGSRRLETATGFSRTTVMAHLRLLRDMGWIEEADATPGNPVRRFPKIPEGGQESSPLGGQETGPLTAVGSGQESDRGGQETDGGGQVFDGGGQETSPYLKENSELTQNIPLAPKPAHCVCGTRRCKHQGLHAKAHRDDPQAFIAALAKGMEMPNAS